MGGFDVWTGGHNPCPVSVPYTHVAQKNITTVTTTTTQSVTSVTMVPTMEDNHRRSCDIIHHACVRERSGMNERGTSGTRV